MKSMLKHCTLPLLILVLCSLALLSDRSSAASQETRSPIKLELFTNADSFLPGQLVDLRFKATNVSGKSVTLDPTSVYSGNLQLYVSFEGGPFRKYLGPGWAVRDATFARPFDLHPGESFESNATLLFNHAFPTAHLTKMYADQIRSERLDNDYAFDNPGSYLLKAVMHLGEAGESTESVPLAVTVLEPQGSDAEVWRVMKATPEIGHLIQTGCLRAQPSHPKSKRALQAAEQILESQPDSSYTPAIAAKLTSYKESIARLKARGAFKED